MPTADGSQEGAQTRSDGGAVGAYDPLAEDKFHDECGVVAIASREAVAPYIYYALQALQHRGQESAGITTLEGLYEFHTRKEMGLVDQVFHPRNIAKLRGEKGIGHVRYSTSAGSNPESAQPQVVSSQAGGIALAHNGNIPNVDDVMDELKAKGWAFYTGNDTEVVVRLLANNLTKHDGDHLAAIEATMDRLEGAYSFTFMVGSELYAVRDPLGVKPLCIGKMPDNIGGHIAASESVALDVVGAEWVRDVHPGEIIRITAEGIESLSHRPAPQPAHCFFEYVYFARADAWMDGRLNQEVRENIGRVLAEEAPVEADLVAPVPDSGRSHASGYAAASGLPYTEALMKNRYVHRTFIMPNQESRDLNVRLKVNPIKQAVEGKRIVLIDDSIVRGTTMRRIVRMLRDAGAKEVHIRIGSPPILAPCYLGIDMNDRDQLVAANMTVDGICEMIGADSLRYISHEGLVKAIGLPDTSLCMGCITGRYPVPVAGEKMREARGATDMTSDGAVPAAEAGPGADATIATH